MDARKKDRLAMGCLILVAAILIISFVGYVFWGILNHL